MKQIMKSQLYQIRTDKILMLALLGVGFLMWDTWSYAVANMREYISFYNWDGMCGGGVALISDVDTGYAGALPYLILVLAVVMGKDYADKTIHYDILAGYSRRQAFFGRLFAAVLVGWSVLFLAAFIRVMFYTFRYGWGNVLDGTQYLACIAICLLVFYRITGEVTLLTVATRRYGITLFVCTVIGLMEYLTVLFTIYGFSEQDHTRAWFLALPAIELFLHPNQVGEYQENAEIVWHWIQMPEAYVVVGTIILSITIGTVCLFLSCKLFEKRDMD